MNDFLKKSAVIISLIAIGFSLIIYTACNQAVVEENKEEDVIIKYSGSDPKGDYVMVEINKTSQTVTHHNYTTGENNGPFAYTKVTGTAAWGFNIIYKAIINAAAPSGQPSYVLFAEFPQAAVIFQIFDVDDEPVGNPQYAITRQALTSGSIKNKAYNWMNFKIDPDSDSDTDMSCGFAAWDTADSGLLYGAGYSKRAEEEGWPGFVYGIHDINEGDVLHADDFIYDSSTVSSYVYQGASDPGHKLTLTGTPSGSVILDFGIDLGGGSGLAIPQSSNATWNSSWNGTYFVMVYEYIDAVSDSNNIHPMKCVINNGNVKVFSIADNTGTATAQADFNLTAISLLSAADSPGGTTAIKDQFATASGNSSAAASIVQNAHNCFGAFVNVDTDEVTMIMFDPNGKFGGFIGFTDTGSELQYRFGFTINDPAYSNAGL